MKRIITISIIAMFMVCALFPLTIMAGNKTSYNVTMHKTPNKRSEHNMSLDPGGRRTPSIPIYCIISKTTGLNIVGLTEDIISYEIWDTSSEINFASFSNESDFLYYLFIQTGNFKLSFETENYNICGYITID